MNRFTALTALVISTALLTSTACKSETEHGQCIGLDDEPRPDLQYEISTRNAVWTAIGVETIVAPVIWGLSMAYCPVGRLDRGAPDLTDTFEDSTSTDSTSTGDAD